MNHFVGYWRYLPGNPTNCKLKIANVPAAITPLVFSDCPSKRVGCRKLEITWTKNIYDALDFLGPEPVRRIGNRAYVLVQRKWPRDLPMQHTGATDALMTTIEEVDGQVTFATGIIMAPPPFNVCVYDMSYSDDGVAIHALPRPYQSWDIFAWHAWPPSPEVTSETFPHWKLGNGCDYCTSLEPSASMLPCQCWGPRGPVFFNTVNRTLNGLVYDGSGRIVMRSVKDGWISIWSDGEPRGIDLVRFDASTTPLVRHARAITALAVDRTDGDRLVWMEADDQGGFKAASASRSQRCGRPPTPHQNIKSRYRVSRTRRPTRPTCGFPVATWLPTQVSFCISSLRSLRT